MTEKKTAKFRIVLIVVGVSAVILVAAAVLISSRVQDFSGFKAKAMQSEAKSSLTQAYMFAQLHSAEHDSFDGYTLKDSGIRETETSLYKLSIRVLDGETFKALAKAPSGALAPCAGEDIWSIDQNKNLVHEKDGMTSCK